MSLISTCEVQQLENCCGIVEFGGFELEEDFGWVTEGTEVDEVHLGSAGLACAAFINNPRCRAAYDILKERFNIVYQSTPRRNSNSGNRLFFVVYDGAKKSGKVIYNKVK